MQELLDPENTGDHYRYEKFVDNVQPMLVMTGFVRSCLNLVVVLCVLYFVELNAPQWLQLVKYTVALFLGAVAVTLFSVVLPVSIAQHFPDRLLAGSINVLDLGLAVFKPVASLMQLLDPIFKRFSHANGQESNENPLSEEVMSVVDEHPEQGKVDQTQKEMLEGVFELPSTTAGQIMTPRTDIAGIEITANLSDIQSVILRGGYSRIPVFQGSLDNIVGILYAKDLIQFIGTNPTLDLRKILREAIMVPESKSLRELLSEFKTRKVHMAIVLDEYGGTAGLVTIEDIIEEIVGEIQDEYESQQENPAIRRIDENLLEVDARAYIDDLNNELGVKLPDHPDYDTLGGYVFSSLGHIPGVGESFEYKHLRFTVTDAERTKVKTVRVQILEKPSDDEDPEEHEESKPKV